MARWTVVSSLLFRRSLHSQAVATTLQEGNLQKNSATFADTSDTTRGETVISSRLTSRMITDFLIFPFLTSFRMRGVEKTMHATSQLQFPLSLRLDLIDVYWAKSANPCLTWPHICTKSHLSSISVVGLVASLFLLFETVFTTCCPCSLTHVDSRTIRKRHR